MEIKQQTYFEVDGKSFKTEEEANRYVVEQEMSEELLKFAKARHGAKDGEQTAGQMRAITRTINDVLKWERWKAGEDVSPPPQTEHKKGRGRPKKGEEQPPAPAA